MADFWGVGPRESRLDACWCVSLHILAQNVSVLLTPTRIADSVEAHRKLESNMHGTWRRALAVSLSAIGGW